ncbi:MAG TPA: gluconate 2-dehydrogenase subunit 3 family protein [Candidatus Sulfopaludibacter sp.]|nr:gluconate 2-dehydrogenase subunit 3 family protein [Candidatus Sulfopaludibacter sp.]
MNESNRIDRREAIKWIVAATATVSLLNFRSFGAPVPAAKGYGTDPDLLKDYEPGDLWPLTLTREQHRAVAALCDVIIPADERSPGASSLGVPDFIDEWISAPYPGQQADREEVLNGLAWLDRISAKRFGRFFADLDDRQKHSICDDICFVPKAKTGFKNAARFFAKFRNLTAGGFYTTPQGWKDIQYLGNVVLAKFDGPPPEVLKYLHLA